jgi:glycosyltransferase involved in cell wall biosynthesis
MKVAILWTRLSGYLNACMKELASRPGVELCVIHEAADSEAPFDEEQFGWIAERSEWNIQPDLDFLRRKMQEFSPDILVISGWAVRSYRRIAKEYRGKCVRVMTMDNPWNSEPKQVIGTWISPFYVQPITDFAWVAGERQAVFARKLGFQEGAILRGVLSCDQAAFAAVHQGRIASGRTVPHAFLYAGRFSSEKGLDVLVQAYTMYRARSVDAWPLICCGAGPLRPLLEDKEGINIEGFVQPKSLPARFASSGCLILSSTIFEHWSLVIHEAASAGLIVLSSEKAGASVHLVQPGYNGFIVGSGDANGLAKRMSDISTMSDAELDAMSQASYSLSRQYSPQLWADTLLRAASSCSMTANRLRRN